MADERIAVLLAVIMLIGAGAYVCIRREVQASAKFVIRGRPALSIGIALITGGIFTVVIPGLLGFFGMFKDFVGALLLSFAIVGATLVYVVLVILAEKRKQATVSPPPTPGEVHRF